MSEARELHHDDWYELCNRFTALKSAAEGLLPFINDAFIHTTGSRERYDALSDFKNAIAKDIP